MKAEITATPQLKVYLYKSEASWLTTVLNKHNPEPGKDKENTEKLLKELNRLNESEFDI